MATPFNPFGAPHGNAQTSATSTLGRGRGASAARGTTFQSRGSRSRTTKWRGAGRGQPTTRGRGRGAGVAPSVTSHSAVSNAQLPNPSTLNSPFAQIDQRNSPANPFGNQTIQQSQSPFSAIANGNTGRNGQPAPRGAIKRSFPRQSPTSSTNSGSMASVPVEDASTVASYHERYEQVSIINH